MAFLKKLLGKEPEPSSVWLTPTEWKVLMDEVLSPLMEREPGLAYLGGYTWAGPWEDHRRKMVRVFLINQSFGTLQWGWSLDFVPHIAGNGLAWHRTDKSARQDVWEVSPDFVKGTGRARETTTFGAAPRGSGGLEAIRAEHRRAFQTLLPLMRAYYAQTDTPEKLLRRVRARMADRYFQFVEGVPQTICAAFLAAALGQSEEARTLLEQLDFPEEKRELPVLLREKLDRQPRLWAGDGL